MIQTPDEMRHALRDLILHHQQQQHWCNESTSDWLLTLGCTGIRPEITECERILNNFKDHVANYAHNEYGKERLDPGRPAAKIIAELERRIALGRASAQRDGWRM
jgi:hypothetical protein